MAKDDYFVIVYQILSYLYQCLKKGADVDPQMIHHDSPLLNINKRYWSYVMYNMHREGFIEGIHFLNNDMLDYPLACDVSKAMITPIGIEYLCDNSTITKAKQFAKQAVDLIAPFIKL